MCLHAVCGFLVNWFYALFPEFLLQLSHYLTSPNNFCVCVCVCVHHERFLGLCHSRQVVLVEVFGFKWSS